MSISKIAQVAGVPYSTTWRVINQAPGVSPEKAEAVRKAIALLGNTVPSIKKKPRMFSRDTGSALNGSLRKRSIALLYLGENSPLCVYILRTVQQLLSAERMNMIFAHVAGPDDLPPAVRDGQVGGILGSGEFPAAAVTEELKQIPAVWMMTPFDDRDDPWGDRVMANHRAIGRLAARYLISKGLRRVAYLSPIRNHFSLQRGSAFLDAANAAGLESVQQFEAADHAAYLFGSPSQTITAAVTDCVEQWLSSDDRADGLFVPNDVIASIVYSLMRSRGLRPQVDVQIISCDRRLEELSLLDPPPPSIDINRDKIARLAVERLLWRMRERAELQQAADAVPVDGVVPSGGDGNSKNGRRLSINEQMFPPVQMLVAPTLEGF